MVEELERNMTVLKAQLNRHDKTIEDNKAAEAQWSEVVNEKGASAPPFPAALLNIFLIFIFYRFFFNFQAVPTERL
jgi:hypothetical protein